MKSNTDVYLQSFGQLNGSLSRSTTLQWTSPPSEKMEDNIGMMDEGASSDSSSDSTASAPATVSLRKTKENEVWTNNKESRAYVFKLFTCFYMILIVIAGIVIELSNLISMERKSSSVSSVQDLILGVWLFGGSIAFIIYCLYLVWRDQKRIADQRKSILEQGGVLPSKKVSVPNGVKTLFPETVHPHLKVLSNSSTGSLYLRLGCVVFGLIGVIYYGLIFVICILGWNTETENDGECTPISDILNFLAMCFIFIQIWFVYCNGKILFTGRGNIARVGLMHLTGTNLWMWLRYIIYEEVETIAEIKRAQNYTPAPYVAPHHEHRALSGVAPSWEPYPDHHHDGEECKGVLCLFSGYNEFMYTCVVEYSLICAGVAFVFWCSLESKKPETIRHKLKRSLLTIDCSRTSEGLFAGFGFVVVTILAIAVFNAYSDKKEMAQWIFSCTNFSFFCMSTFMVCYAFWRMRVLKFGEEKEEEEESAELLDRILLVLGLLGELVFSVGGILSFVNTSFFTKLSIIMFLTNVLRLVQVTLQSGLILVSSKLVLDEENAAMMRFKPGKQVITLLLMMNCAQFLMNVFEAQKAGVDEEIVRMYGSYYWAVLIRGCSPLTIFFRFHSSACFAEIWKKTFRVHRLKHNHATAAVLMAASRETEI